MFTKEYLLKKIHEFVFDAELYCSRGSLELPFGWFHGAKHIINFIEDLDEDVKMEEDVINEKN